MQPAYQMTARTKCQGAQCLIHGRSWMSVSPTGAPFYTFNGKLSLPFVTRYFNIKMSCLFTTMTSFLLLITEDFKNMHK